MARISIDDDIESRLEYRKLLKILGGNHNEALGMLLSFWRLAQKYWGQGLLVPMAEMEAWEFQPLIESKWAIVEEEGVYAIGSEKHFAWYRQRCDAGKQGGRPPKPGETGTKPEQTETSIPETGTPSLHDSENPLTTSLSLVPVLSPKQKKRIVSNGAEKLPALALLWNIHADPKLRRVEGMHPGGKRFSSCQRRWLEKPDPDFWIGVISQLNQTPFCLGENDRGWKAGIEFLCRPDTPDNLAEGKYTQARAGGGAPSADDSYWDFLKPSQEPS